MRSILTRARRLLSVIMAVLLTCSLIPASALTVYADGAGGSFVLMALSGGQALIQPTTISYSEGASVKEALLSSGYSFAGLEEDDWINAVEGVSDSYALYYDNGGYDLSVSADQITAFWITGNYDQGYSNELLSLEKTLAEYREANDGRQQYAPLAEAAEAALSGFWSADATTAAALEAEILYQMETYYAIITGETAPVSLQISQNGSAVIPAVSTFTNAFGTTTVFENQQEVSLVPGDYRFDISDGAHSHVLGNITVVAGDQNVLTAELPSGQWIADVDLGITSAWTQAVAKTGSFGSDAVYYVPDYAGSSLYIYASNAEGIDTENVHLYFGANDSMAEEGKVWNSHYASVQNALVKDSLESASVTVQAAVTGADGYRQLQSYDLSIVRVPTLASLSVSSEGTLLPLDYDPETREYSLSVVTETVDVTGTLVCPEAQLAINGNSAESGSDVSVPLRENAVTDITVTASAGGVEQSYVLHVERRPSVEVALNHASGMETSLKNAAGAQILPSSTTGSCDIYHLTPGETYTWIGTRESYYHTSGSFTATAGLNVDAATPITDDWLSSMTAKSSTAASGVVYEAVPSFEANVHELDLRVGSSRNLFYIRTDLANTGYSVRASYTNYQGLSVDKDVTTGKFMTLAGIVHQSGRGTDLLLTITKTGSGSTTYYQEYKVNVCRLMELTALSAADPFGNPVILTQDNESEKTSFDVTVLEYKASIQKSIQELFVSAKLFTSLAGNDTEAVITVASPGGNEEISFDDGTTPDTLQTVSVPLNPNEEKEEVTVTVRHPATGAVSQNYVITVKKLDPAMTAFNLNPEDATVFLIDDLSGSRILPGEDGRYSLSDTLSYTYTITAKGYVGVTGNFTASKNTGELTFTLEKAEASSYEDISGEDDWSSFRQDETNNGVTTAATPIDSDQTVLVWANKIGEGYGSGATGCPILVGGYLYTYAGTSIVKVDKNTGEIVQAGQMAGSSSFAINSPTYAEGMIFVGLSNGRVQAFNADTLESLWVYTDPLGGQSNSTITYQDGYVYTGFWNGETKTANYVCLSVTDEDPSNTTEEKLATWRYTDTGFYWAGAYATENYVLVTTDDGASGSTSGYGSVVSLDPSTGRVIDTRKMPVVGDLRSSICYDAATDACYFTSKGGYFCKIRVNADGTFREDSLQTMKLSNGTDGTAMSTSTPTIYNGRAYIGVCGTGQFTAYSGHNISVIDLASWTIAYSIPTQGYPQTSGLLTTAYEGDDNYVYVYFLDNYTPGKIRVLRDKAGQMEPDPAYTTKETYTVKGVTYEVETAYVLFTPSGKQAQYAICSPIVDAEGNLYFKNDSAQLMKLSSTITSLEVTAAPDTSVYCVGQTFDPTGLKVIARYANGTSKDISQYISCYSDLDFQQKTDETPLTAENSSIYLKFDLDKMLQGDTGYWTLYHNEAGEAGVEVASIPYGEIAVTVETEHPDADNDGFCDRCGVRCKFPAEIIEQPQTVRAGLKAKISYHVTAEHAVAYQWFYSKDGSKWYKSSASSAATDTLSVTISSSNKTNLYRCKLTGEDGSFTYTDTAAIDLIPGVVITKQPSSVTAKIGQTINYSVEADNVASYQWFYSKDGLNWIQSGATGNKTACLTLKVSSTNKNYQYKCRMTGIDGNLKNSVAVGVVIVTQEPTTSTATIGSLASFSIRAENIAAYQWQYSKNNGDSWFNSGASGYNTDTMSLKVSNTNKGYIYRCKLTTTNGITAFTGSAGFTAGQ